MQQLVVHDEEAGRWERQGHGEGSRCGQGRRHIRADPSLGLTGHWLFQLLVLLNMDS